MEKLIYLDNAATTLRKPPGVAEAVAQAILTAGNAARGAHCAPRLHEALGTVRQGAVRFSFSVFNSEDEADMAIQAVKELAQSK